MSGSMKSHFVRVVGVTYEGRQELIEQLREGDYGRLVPEPTNPYDVNAIAVHIPHDGEVFHIGYIKREFAAEVAPKMEGESLDCRIHSISGGYDNGYDGWVSYGVILQVELPE